MANPAVLTPRARATALTALGTGTLVLLSLVPLADGIPPQPPLALLVALAGFAALALSLAATAQAAGNSATLTLVRGAAMWAACGVAWISAGAAVAATAQTLDLGNVVRAQLNTSLYLLLQPAAASVFTMTAVLAADDATLHGVFGAPGVARRASELGFGFAVSALAATLFLGGYGGPWLPAPVWLVLKAAVVLAVLVLLRRRFASVAPKARVALAFGAAIAGLLNLAVTLVVVAQ